MGRGRPGTRAAALRPDHANSHRLVRAAAILHPARRPRERPGARGWCGARALEKFGAGGGDAKKSQKLPRRAPLARSDDSYLQLRSCCILQCACACALSWRQLQCRLVGFRSHAQRAEGHGSSAGAAQLAPPHARPLPVAAGRGPRGEQSWSGTSTGEQPPHAGRGPRAYGLVTVTGSKPFGFVSRECAINGMACAST